MHRRVQYLSCLLHSRLSVAEGHPSRVTLCHGVFRSRKPYMCIGIAAGWTILQNWNPNISLKNGPVAIRQNWRPTTKSSGKFTPASTTRHNSQGMRIISCTLCPRSFSDSLPLTCRIALSTLFTCCARVISLCDSHTPTCYTYPGNITRRNTTGSRTLSCRR